MLFADRLEGGLYGLLIGDALGVPYEFHAPGNLPPREEIEMSPPADWQRHRSHGGTPVGTWSDDGAQALCLLASLLHCDRFDAEDFGHRLVNWSDHGYLAVDGRVFDIGNQTSRAIERLRAGVPALAAGPSGERDNGNGSLMRVLPLALWHRGTDKELVRDAALQSQVTHGHPRAQLCCAVYVLWARGALNEVADPWDAAVETVKSLLGSEPVFRDELARVLAFASPAGSGYVVDALWSARIAVQAGPYDVAVRRAVQFGQDTDTTACIAGGIAGVRDGAGAIPQRWRDALRGRELVDPLWLELLRRWG